MDLLEHLLGASPDLERSAVPSLAAWLARLDAPPFTASIDRAAWAGFEADRLGYAFAGGYEAALGRLLATSAAGRAVFPRRLSLAATEAGGVHPRAIETKLEGPAGAQVLRGLKTFATLASVADELLVVATRGAAADGRNALVLVRVRADAPNLTIEDRAALPFAPEIPHARVTLAGVAVRDEDVLPGDGYAAYLKPFRTIEDRHVLAAALGFVVRLARARALAGAAGGVVERALALVAALGSIAARDPADPAGHLALAGVFAQTRQLVTGDGDFSESLDDATRERWQRDLPLLLVAEAARQKRTEAAWARASRPAT